MLNIAGSTAGLFGFITAKIRNKILVTLFIVSLIPLVLIGSALLVSSRRAVKQQAADQLETIRKVKAKQLREYFDTTREQVVSFSENRMVQEAVGDFRQSLAAFDVETELTDDTVRELRTKLKAEYIDSLGSNDVDEAAIDEQIAQLDKEAVYLQYHYLTSSSDDDSKADTSSYGDYHGKYDPIISNYASRFDYQNIMLFDGETGRLLYSVDKNVDFMTSLMSGVYASTHLGDLVKRTATVDNSNAIAFADFQTYGPSNSTPSGFFASPVIADGTTLGIVVFQLPIASVNEIMADSTGLGDTGETYVIGTDYRFRNDSRFLERLDVASTVLNPKFTVDTEAVKAAFDGEAGTSVVTGYESIPVLSSWGAVTIFDGDDATGLGPVTWATVAEKQLSEVQAPLKAITTNALWFALAAGVVVLIVSLFVARSFLRQTNAITEMLQSIGIGDFDARAEVLSNDELGRVAEALNAMCDNTLSLIQSKDERDRIEEAVKQLKSEVAAIASGDLTVEAEVDDSLTGAIADSVNDMVAQLRGIVRNVQEATYHVSSSANEIHSRTQELSIGSEAQSTQILDTSAAIESMANSVHRISANTSQSAAVAQNARDCAAKGADAVQDTIHGMTRIRDQVQDSAKRIKRLGETSQEVGEIVQLIGDIADRTSILALNASIQAAMAGEAGQGFAVVAEEVERLAERSNDATKQIETLIKAIQNDTAEAISAMEASTGEVVEGSKLAAQAGEALSEIDTVSADLANVINSVANETKEQARSAEAVSKSMTEISQVSLQTAEGTKQAAISVNSLADLADDLSGSVTTFKLPTDFQRTNDSINSVLAAAEQTLNAELRSTR